MKTEKYSNYNLFSKCLTGMEDPSCAYFVGDNGPIACPHGYELEAALIGIDDALDLLAIARQQSNLDFDSRAMKEAIISLVCAGQILAWLLENE